jgi:hypothetical protein
MLILLPQKYVQANVSVRMKHVRCSLAAPTAPECVLHLSPPARAPRRYHAITRAPNLGRSRTRSKIFVKLHSALLFYANGTRGVRHIEDSGLRAIRSRRMRSHNRLTTGSLYYCMHLTTRQLTQQYSHARVCVRTCVQHAKSVRHSFITCWRVERP